MTTPTPTANADAVHWIGTEDDQFAERLKACRSRRTQYGQRSCSEKDGSCEECEHDMARALRDTPDRRKKLGIPLNAEIDQDGYFF